MSQIVHSLEYGWPHLPAAGGLAALSDGTSPFQWFSEPQPSNRHTQMRRLLFAGWAAVGFFVSCAEAPFATTAPQP